MKKQNHRNKHNNQINTNTNTNNTNNIHNISINTNTTTINTSNNNTTYTTNLKRNDITQSRQVKFNQKSTQKVATKDDNEPFDDRRGTAISTVSTISGFGSFVLFCLLHFLTVFFDLLEFCHLQKGFYWRVFLACFVSFRFLFIFFLKAIDYHLFICL